MPTRSQRNPVAPLILIGGGVLLILGALVWFFVFANQPTQTATTNPQTDEPYPQITRISVKDAKAAHDIGNAIFLDVRDDASYQSSHIPGAVLIPIEELSDRLSELNPEDWIITYCT